MQIWEPYRQSRDFCRTRDICDKYGTLLIFDEVITGFRMQADGAQGYFGVTPDLTTFGKIIGAGMPVGAYGGRREIMEMVSPVGAVYQAGTLSGNPVAMAAGIAQLSYLKEHPEAYAALNQKSDRFFEELQKIVDESGRGYHVNHITSLGSLFLQTGKLLIMKVHRHRIQRHMQITAITCRIMAFIWLRRSLRQYLFPWNIQRSS